MQFMMSLYFLLLSLGSGPTAPGMTVEQAYNASSNYTVNGTLPTAENVRRLEARKPAKWTVTSKRAL